MKAFAGVKSIAPAVWITMGTVITRCSEHIFDGRERIVPGLTRVSQQHVLHSLCIAHVKLHGCHAQSDDIVCLVHGPHQSVDLEVGELDEVIEEGSSSDKHQIGDIRV